MIILLIFPMIRCLVDCSFTHDYSRIDIILQQTQIMQCDSGRELANTAKLTENKTLANNSKKKKKMKHD